MATKNPQVKIVFAGDATGLTQALADVGGKSGGLQSKLGGLTGSLGKVTGALGGMYAVKEVGQFLGESATAALEDAKAKEILHTAIRNVTGASDDQLSSLDSYIEKTQAATGFTEEELRPAMTKLVGATKDVGKAQDLLGIAMDVATARGVPLETVTLALEKAQNGNLSSLQRMGVATKDASGNALSYDQVLQNLASTYGGATAAAADTMAGKMERTKLMFGEMKEALGAQLMPIIEKFAGFIMENMPTIEAIFGGIGTAISGLMPIVETVFQVITSVLESIKTAWSENGAELTAIITPIWDGIKGLIQTAMDLVGGIIKTVMAIIAGDWSGAWDGIKGIVSSVWDLIKGIVQLALDIIKGIITGILDAIKTIWSGVWNGIKDVAASIWNDIKGSASAIWNGVKDTLSGIWTEIKDAFGRLWDGMKEAWNTAAGWIGDIPGKIKGFFTGAGRWLYDIGKSILTGLLDGLKAAWTNTVDFLKGLGSKIKDLKGPIEKDRVLLQDEGKAIIEGLGKGMAAAWPGVEDVLSGMNRRMAGNAANTSAGVTNSQRYTNVTVQVSGNDGVTLGRQIATILGGV